MTSGGSPDPGAVAAGSARPDAGQGVSPPPAGRARTLLRGTSWQLAAQLAPLVVNLALTPFVILKLGAVAYGLFLITSTLTQFIAQFDGGIGRSATRYFALYAGQDDRVATTRLLCSLLVCIVAITSVTLSLAFAAAAPLVDFFHAPPELYDDTTLLLRVMIVLLGVSLSRGLFASVLNAHQRFGVSAATLLLGYAVYAIGIVWTLNLGMGLRGLAYVFVAQQVVGTLLIIPSSLRHLSRAGVGFISRAELRAFWAMSLRVQASGLLGMVGWQGSMLIVGRLAPAQVSTFGPGSTFAQQLQQIPLNAMGPIQAMLGRAVGADGAEQTRPLMERLQRIWVLTMCGWVGVGAPAAYFGVNVWLPLPGVGAGIVAATMLASYLLALISSVLTTWAMLLHRPEYDMWASLITVTLMLGLSGLLVPSLGAYGVALAAVVGQGASLTYRLAMIPRLPVPVRSPLREVPWVATLVCAALSFASVGGMSALIDHHVLPRGGVGLLLCGLAAAPVLVLYLSVTVGLRRAVALLRGRAV